MDRAHERRLMVERQWRGRAIHDERVLAAMLSIPREEFIPEELRRGAYQDEPVGIGCQQTISQPYMTALMAQSLALTGNDVVLEIGAGSGYAAAVMGAIARRVFAVELIPELAETARRTLARTGLDGNITVITGDGSLGYPSQAPYDAISVAAGARETPPALIEQLQDPGRLVIPVGGCDEQELIVSQKAAGVVTSRVAARCRFVPLRGACEPGVE
jgi:protein-L-isoaspartate(D-aspartate) O-methyltransferase